jgi:hypothetical protein
MTKLYLRSHSDPVRVFVAATVAEWLPTRVLEFSIKETGTLPVHLLRIASFDRRIPLPRDLRNQPRTPFSFQRFLIPELCGYQGRAIYLDADMQLFSDIGALWNAPMDGHDLLAVREGTAGRKGQFSVVLLDCERLQWRIESIVQELDDGRYTYEQLMSEMCVADSVGRTLDPGWNSLEAYAPGRTHLLHYTDMDTQPWVSLKNPLAHLWVECLRRAIAAGFITEEELAREIAAGHVRPSLMAQLKQPTARNGELHRLDAGFVAPYRSIRSGKASPWMSWRSMLSFYARRGLQRLDRLAGR